MTIAKLKFNRKTTDFSEIRIFKKKNYATSIRKKCSFLPDIIH